MLPTICFVNRYKPWRPTVLMSTFAECPDEETIICFHDWALATLLFGAAKELQLLGPGLWQVERLSVKQWIKIVRRLGRAGAHHIAFIRHIEEENLLYGESWRIKWVLGPNYDATVADVTRLLRNYVITLQG
jgi:hypothetical protein